MSGPLKIVALGLDERALNLFRMFFRGPCQNQAVIVENDHEGEVFLIDLDTPQGTKLLVRQREEHPERLFIALSVRDQEESASVIPVKKPTQAQSMIAAIERARNLTKATPVKEKKSSLFGWATRKSTPPPPPPAPPVTSPSPPPVRHVAPPPPPPQTKKPTPPPSPAIVKHVGADGMKVVANASIGKEKDDAAVHKVAMLLDEQGFKSYMGTRDDIDPNNFEQLANAFYDPKVFLQGHVQSAVKVALTRNEAIRLETPWKSITVLPREGLVHIQADEAQIRAACGIPFRNIVGVDMDAISLQQVVNLKPVPADEVEEILNSGHTLRLDAFVWKVALFTSKGRLPKGLDINQAVYLKHWPSMTRLMLPPHAMRIAAFLVAKPFSLIEAAKKMGIRQQYMFAFVSAAHALGLIGQQPIPEATDSLPEPEQTASNKPERKSLLSKILGRLKLI